MKNVEQTVPVAEHPFTSASRQPIRRSRFVDYLADSTARNLSLDAGTAQAAGRIETDSPFSDRAPHWANGTKADGSDEQTSLIDTAHFNQLLASATPPKAEPPPTDDPLLESDYELTRVHIGDLLADEMAGWRAHDEVTALIATQHSADPTEVTSSVRRPTPPAAACPAPPAAACPAPPVAARPAPPVAARPVHRNDEHTSILTEDQRDEWLQTQNQENTTILSLPEVAQWLEKPQQAAMRPPAAMASSAPMPAAHSLALSPSPGVFSNAPMNIAEGTITPNLGASQGPSDEDLFALPHQVGNASTTKPASKWLGNAFLGFFALMAVVAGLAFALPAQRAEVQERIFPTAKAPTVTTTTRAEVIAVAPAKVEMSAQETERLMSRAASAVASGRRTEALKIYQELSAAHPSLPLYSNLVHALKVSEATK